MSLLILLLSNYFYANGILVASARILFRRSRIHEESLFPLKFNVTFESTRLPRIARDIFIYVEFYTYFPSREECAILARPSGPINPAGIQLHLLIASMQLLPVGRCKRHEEIAQLVPVVFLRHTCS